MFSACGHLFLLALPPSVERVQKKMLSSNSMSVESMHKKMPTSWEQGWSQRETNANEITQYLQIHLSICHHQSPVWENVRVLIPWPYFSMTSPHQRWYIFIFFSLRRWQCEFPDSGRLHNIPLSICATLPHWMHISLVHWLSICLLNLSEMSFASSCRFFVYPGRPNFNLHNSHI